MLIQNKIINPLKGWTVNRDDIQYLGQDLQRPECILTEPDGTVWTADARGGVVKMNHNGLQEIINPFKKDDTLASLNIRRGFKMNWYKKNNLKISIL